MIPKPRIMKIQDYILWEDEAVIAVNKPAGLRTIADGYDPKLPHLSGLLVERYGRVWTVHRLDRDTSGVIIFARSADAHRALNDQFAGRETRKEYLAIVIGMPGWEDATVDLPLRVDGDRRHRTVIDHQAGKPAETEFHVLRRLGPFTHLAALPHTGYTHQIRAHLAAVDLPILADPLYRSLRPATTADEAAAKAAKALPIRRAALHAFQLRFTHPLTGQPMEITAPLAEDFAAALEELGKQSS